MLIPVVGCLVKLPDQERTGEVIANVSEPSGPVIVLVRWPSNADVARLPAEQLMSGFTLRSLVQDVPGTRIRQSLGVGEVIETRKLGGRWQHLVEFAEAGSRVWLPYENLRFVRGARQRFLLNQTASVDNAERFRLRALAYAISSWHENTGALSRLNIDPLPHQIHLVHHILKSGNLNWLIADDVGLGKTVEVGMLLSALKQRGNCRRILLVTPAGLVKQWKEEMHYKFGLSDFRIYGEDFHIKDARDWKLYDHVIGSLDKLKHDSHINILMQAGEWDLVVFDEAHRLSRNQFGMKFDASERFQLAKKLRSLTDSIVLLSATPHQGKQDKFQALLELIRPELREQILGLALDPAILAKMVIRNNKSDVTDAHGNFIFTGKTTKAITVPVEQDAVDFDKALQQYLRKGYAAGKQITGTTGRAIGFVMTVYRKLAASSIAAITAALERRMQRLCRESTVDADQSGRNAPDERYMGEWEEGTGTGGKEFFAGEIESVSGLLVLAKRLARTDAKLRAFIDELVKQVLRANPAEKILIFSEYRATQDYLVTALRDRFGAGAVSVIHGSMSHEERAASIELFETDGQFLISTEAGAEGINLQRHCNIMVNFDLPWNPMRLVQRVGRLYRYGQKKKVVVFNMHAPQTLDAEIMITLYARVDQVVADMASLGGEFGDGLKDEIMGEIADLLDVEEILEEALTSGIRRTEDRIKEALEKAKGAAAKQRELFENVTGFNPADAKGELRITRAHVRSFVLGMCQALQVGVIGSHDGAIATLTLPDAVREKLRLKRGAIKVAFDRDVAKATKCEMVDFESSFFKFLIDEAMRIEFGGLAARLTGLPGAAMFASMLRWQDDQGRRTRQEFAAVLVTTANQSATNLPAIADWLLHPAQEGSNCGDRELASHLLQLGGAAIDLRLRQVANDHVHPENTQLLGCGWIS